MLLQLTWPKDTGTWWWQGKVCPSQFSKYKLIGKIVFDETFQRDFWKKNEVVDCSSCSQIISTFGGCCQPPENRWLHTLAHFLPAMCTYSPVMCIFSPKMCTFVCAHIQIIFAADLCSHLIPTFRPRGCCWPPDDRWLFAHIPLCCAHLHQIFLHVWSRYMFDLH